MIFRQVVKIMSGTRRFRRAAILCLALSLLFFTAVSGLGGLKVYSLPAPIISHTDISSTDISDEHFQRVSMIPLNVDIPYFYQEVANISGMYIFTLPDNTVYKRIYGALDDVYGWYEPQGFDNKVLPGSPLIDTDEDIILYEEALEAAGIVKQYTSDYYGILPPEQGTSAVNALFGKPATLIYIICGAVTAFLCIVILISSSTKSSGTKNKDDRSV